MIAIIGQNYTAITSFLNKDKTPFCATEPVTYKVYSYDNIFILQGSAIQDNIRPSDWYANFVIPEGSPVPNDTNNEQYYIEFFATNTTQQLQSKQYFQVVDNAEPVSYDSSVLTIKGQSITDNLITSLRVTSYTVSIQDDTDRVLYTATNNDPQSVLKNNCYVTKINMGSQPSITDNGIGFFPYLVIYTYETEDNITNTEVHTLYVMNSKMMLLVNNMRRYLDKARNYDIDPSLRWTDLELAHFVMSGINRYNSSLPTITGFTATNFPTQHTYLLEKCAEHEALNALYLAEGMRAFNFTGASTSLEVDRTQYIQTKMDEIGSWLDNNLIQAKSLLIRTMTGNGRTNIQLTSVTNFRGYGWNGAYAGMYSRMLSGVPVNY